MSRDIRFFKASSPNTILLPKSFLETASFGYPKTLARKVLTPLSAATTLLDVPRSIPILICFLIIGSVPHVRKVDFALFYTPGEYSSFTFQNVDIFPHNSLEQQKLVL